MKKLLATILALVMALSLCTIGWADVTTVKDETELKNAVANGGEIKLAKSISLTETMEVKGGKSVVIDMNGYDITATSSAAFKIENGSTGCINSNAFGLYDTTCRRAYHRHIPFQALYHTVDVQSTIVCFQFTSNIDNHTISATFITANHNRIAIRAFHGHIFIDSKCAIICRTRFL